MYHSCKKLFVFRSGAGKEQITKLHDILYTGPLLQFLKEDIPYIPHVTVGRKESAELAAEVAKDIHSFPEKLQCVIDRISVERIGEKGESIIEFEVPLQKLTKVSFFIRSIK